MARLEFPRETGLILRCAGKAGNPFQTTQGPWRRTRGSLRSSSCLGRKPPRAPQLEPKILQATAVSVLPSITRVLGRQTMLREVLGQLEELIPSGYNL